VRLTCSAATAAASALPDRCRVDGPCSALNSSAKYVEQGAVQLSSPPRKVSPPVPHLEDLVFDLQDGTSTVRRRSLDRQFACDNVLA